MATKSDTPRARHISEAKVGDIVFIKSRPMLRGFYTRARVTRTSRSSIWVVALLYDEPGARKRMERRYKNTDGREFGASSYIQWIVEPGPFLEPSRDEKLQLKREAKS